MLPFLGKQKRALSEFAECQLSMTVRRDVVATRRSRRTIMCSNRVFSFPGVPRGASAQHTKPHCDSSSLIARFDEEKNGLTAFFLYHVQTLSKVRCRSCGCSVDLHDEVA